MQFSDKPEKNISSDISVKKFHIVSNAHVTKRVKIG